MLVLLVLISCLSFQIIIFFKKGHIDNESTYLRNLSSSFYLGFFFGVLGGWRVKEKVHY